MTARKTFRRASPEAARRAMAAHAEQMVDKGWTVEQEFEGDAGVMYECITYFHRAATRTDIRAKIEQMIA